MDLRWHSENGASAPQTIVDADDSMTADKALALLRRGTGLLWRGDFHNARQLTKAVDRRLTKRLAKNHARNQSKKQARKQALRGDSSTSADARSLFLQQRAERAERADILGRILVELGEGWTLDLRRAPDVTDACEHTYGPWAGGDAPLVVSLSELQGVLGAWQWHLKGVFIEELGESVYPDYGVFSPTRSEYVSLVDRAAAARFSARPNGDDPSDNSADSSPGSIPDSIPGSADAPLLEIGTGTGVLAAVLVQQGSGHVTATDLNGRAVNCARTNLDRLGCGDRVDVVTADLWPEAGAVRSDSDSANRSDNHRDSHSANDRYDVVVFNPPWLPGTPSSDLEQGIYDADSDALRRFLAELSDHLTDGGEGWLVLSDLAEHLGLRTRDQLEQWINEGGLRVVGREDTAPRHPKIRDADDSLHVARSREVTSLWRLAKQQ